MNEEANQRICPKCGTENSGINRICKSCGAEIVPGNAEAQTTADKSITCWTPLFTIFFVFFIAVILFNIAFPEIFLIRPRYRSNNTACREQLKNVSIGFQEYISQNGSLKGIRNEDDICQFLIPGAEKPEDCAGDIKDRVENICMDDGTFSVTIVDDLKYEIKAVARDKQKQTICVTEAGIAPDKYKDEFKGCKH